MSTVREAKSIGLLDQMGNELEDSMTLVEVYLHESPNVVFSNVVSAGEGRAVVRRALKVTLMEYSRMKINQSINQSISSQGIS